MSRGGLDLKPDPVAALMDVGDSAIAYFVGRDLRDQEVGPVADLWAHPETQRLLRNQRPDGSWRGPNKRNPVWPANHSDLLATFKQVRLLVERYEMTAAYELGTLLPQAR